MRKKKGENQFATLRAKWERFNKDTYSALSDELLSAKYTPLICRLGKR